MWSSHSCLKSKPFHMYPWPLGSSTCLLCSQSVATHPCTTCTQYIKVYVHLRRCHTFLPLHLFILCRFLWNTTLFPYFSSFQQIFSDIFRQDFLSPPLSLYGTLFFCYSTYQIDDNLLIYLSASPNRLQTKVKTRSMFY